MAIGNQVAFMLWEYEKYWTIVNILMLGRLNDKFSKDKKS
jgi:hypothetical protein